MKNLSPWLNYIISCIAGSIITLIIVYLVKANLGRPLSFTGLIVIAIAVICLFLILFLIYTSLKSSKDDPYPLGLPTGSIRALIAILILVFFVLLSIAFTFSTPPGQVDFVKDIVKTLGTLLIAVSAFYFGSKATEQGFNAGTLSGKAAGVAEGQVAVQKATQEAQKGAAQGAAAAVGAAVGPGQEAAVAAGAAAAGAAVGAGNAAAGKNAGAALGEAVSLAGKGEGEDSSSEQSQEASEEAETPVEININKKSEDNE